MRVDFTTLSTIFAKRRISQIKATVENPNIFQTKAIIINIRLEVFAKWFQFRAVLVKTTPILLWRQTTTNKEARHVRELYM